MGRQCGFAVEVLAKEKDGERDISSSYIREELTAGHMEKRCWCRPTKRAVLLTPPP